MVEIFSAIDDDTAIFVDFRNEAGRQSVVVVVVEEAIVDSVALTTIDAVRTVSNSSNDSIKVRYGIVVASAESATITVWIIVTIVILIGVVVMIVGLVTVTPSIVMFGTNVDHAIVMWNEMRERIVDLENVPFRRSVNRSLKIVEVVIAVRCSQFQ